MEIVSKFKLVGVALATLVVAVCFVGCGDGTPSDGTPSVSIESPLASLEPDRSGNLSLYIQSQDNGTVIEDVIINRGNCGVRKYVTNGSAIDAYRKNHPDRGTGMWVQLRTKSGELVSRHRRVSTFRGGKIHYTYDLYLTDMDYYNALDDESKATYKAEYPAKLPYGERFYVSNKCDGNKIIEVEVVTNGGSFTYKFK